MNCDEDFHPVASLISVEDGYTGIMAPSDLEVGTVEK
jgi:hypothetical protein